MVVFNGALKSVGAVIAQDPAGRLKLNRLLAVVLGGLEDGRRMAWGGLKHIEFFLHRKLSRCGWTHCVCARSA